MPAAGENKYFVGDFVIDTACYSVSQGGVPVPVEPKVFDLLVYLIRNRDRLLTREELFAEVWEGRPVSDATLSNHVKSARRVLGDSGELQRTIQTVRGRGYQFVAEVREAGDTDAVASVEPPAAPTSAATPATEAVPARRSTRLNWLVPLATAFVLLAAAMLFAWRQSATEHPAALAQANEPHLLVLPTEVAAAGAQAWQPWANDLTRRAIGNLRQISGLHVYEQATAFMFEEDRTHAHIQQLLPDVRYVLSSVLDVSAGNEPRITVALDDLVTGKQVWSKSYAWPRSADAQSLDELQSTITAAVPQSLRVTILEEEKLALGRSREPSTTNPAAQALYLEGWKYLPLLDYESLKRALDRFDRAIALDRNFYDAHLARGEALLWIYAYYETPKDVLPKVEAAFRRAHELRPDSAEPLSALGLTYAMVWDWPKAWELLNQARDKDPDLATTQLGFALYYTGLGETKRAKESLYKARDNDPLNVVLADWGNWVLFFLGENDASREWANDMMAKHPNVGFIFSDAAISAYLAGDHGRAIDLADRGRALEDSPVAKIVAAQAYGYSGQPQIARSLLEAAARDGSYTCPYESAVGYLSIGEKETALALLEQAVEKKSNCLVFLRVDPRLEPIRKPPYRKQYLDLLARVGLDDEKWQAYPR
jgi:DNA-binding winged helix-turn-helix (wHTH) protein/tetratricopeptide (TPR) repeat protein